MYSYTLISRLDSTTVNILSYPQAFSEPFECRVQAS